jgi:hypothetical protein
MTTTIKAYKRYIKNAFKGSDLVRAHPQHVD